MFLSLLKIECKQVLRSLVYYLYVIVFVLFVTSQMGDTEWTESVKAPNPESGDYGMKQSDDSEFIMQEVLNYLVWETSENTFTTYPIGFYKEVALSETELEQVWEILVKCCNETKEEVIASRWATPRENLSFEEFEEHMEGIAQIVGRGSYYEGGLMRSLAYEPITYEDALEDYERMCTVDKVTGTYMRLFCDYAGIFLAILPIFIGVTRALRDKRSLVEEVTFSKRVPSYTLMIARYVANVIMVYLPVVITALLIQLPYHYRAQTIGVTPDYFAFLTYTAIWLLPEIMIVLAVSFLITEFTGNSLAILVQVFWGVASLFNMSTLVGDFGMKLVVRWNTVGQTSEYLLQQDQLYINRGFYAVFAIVAILLTVVVYEKKRKEGTTIYGKLVKARR